MDEILSTTSAGDPANRTEKVSVSLYPEHVEIVRSYAVRTRRSFSNALQVVIEDWAKQQPTAVREAVQESA